MVDGEIFDRRLRSATVILAGGPRSFAKIALGDRNHPISMTDLCSLEKSDIQVGFGSGEEIATQYKRPWSPERSTIPAANVE